MTERAVEFLLLFFAGPTIFAFTRHRIPAIPALWLWMAWCLFVLLHDPGFDRGRFWRSGTFGVYLPEMLALFAFVVAVEIALIVRFDRSLLFGLPRSKPRLWAALMVLYPVLSVYPQGIVFRAFLFERYREIFTQRWAIVLASAVAFSWLHIVFRNWLAMFLTFLGGVLFALRYQQTGSLFISSFEHALYGCAIFTIGLGESFYHRALRRPGSG